MSEQLPRIIEPLRLAAKGRHLEGALPLAGMERLKPLLESSTGFAAFVLDFGIDESGTPYMGGHLRADVEMCCQRCLSSMTVTIDADILAGLVRTKEEADQLPAAYEPFLLELSESVLLADIIEDELILGLPIVALHADDMPCAAREQLQVQHQEARGNPFAVLADLKKSM